MAKLGSVSLTGPAVASRAVGGGRSPLAVIRAAGAESGRFASLSPRDTRIADNRSASLNSFLRNFVPVTRVDQIGFVPQTKQGFETVKPLKQLGEQALVAPKPTNEAGVEANLNALQIKQDIPKNSAVWEIIPSYPKVQAPEPELVSKKSLNTSLVIEGKVIAAKSERIVSPAEIKQITRPTSIIGFAPDANFRAAQLIQIAVENRIKTNRLLRKQASMISAESADITSEQEVLPAVLVPNLQIGTKNTAEAAIPNNLSEKKVLQVREPIAQIVRKISSEQLQKKRYAKRDWAMDQRRLRLLNDSYEAIRIENSGADVEGDQIARRSLIGSLREVRSIFLDQRGYYDRVDGTQRKIELMLESARAIDKSRLKEIVNGSNALKDEEDPNNAVSQRQVDEVVNRPDELKRDYEPVEVIAETVVRQTETPSKAVEDLPKYDSTRNLEMDGAVPLIEVMQEKNANQMDLVSSTIDRMGHNIGLTLDSSLDMLSRRELVLFNGGN